MNPKKPRLGGRPREVRTPKEPAAEPTFAESLAITKPEEIAASGPEMVAEIREISADIRGGIHLIASRTDWPQAFRVAVAQELDQIATLFDGISSCMDRIVVAARDSK